MRTEKEIRKQIAAQLEIREKTWQEVYANQEIMQKFNAISPMPLEAKQEMVTARVKIDNGVNSVVWCNAVIAGLQFALGEEHQK